MLHYRTTTVELTISKKRVINLGNFNSKDVFIAVKKTLLPQDNLLKEYQELSEFIEERLDSEIYLAKIPDPIERFRQKQATIDYDTYLEEKKQP